MSTISRWILQAAGGALIIAASGCGGGGGGGGDATAQTPVATSDVPGSAQQSTSGLIAFVNQLISQTSDTAEPIVVGDAVLRTDDTAEAVN